MFVSPFRKNAIHRDRFVHLFVCHENLTLAITFRSQFFLSLEHRHLSEFCPFIRWCCYKHSVKVSEGEENILKTLKWNYICPFDKNRHTKSKQHRLSSEIICIVYMYTWNIQKILFTLLFIRHAMYGSNWPLPSYTLYSTYLFCISIIVVFGDLKKKGKCMIKILIEGNWTRRETMTAWH